MVNRSSIIEPYALNYRSINNIIFDEQNNFIKVTGTAPKYNKKYHCIIMNCPNVTSNNITCWKCINRSKLQSSFALAIKAPYFYSRQIYSVN